MRALASGTGHLHLIAAGQERDYHPVAVSEEEIAEVHLHGVIQTADDYRIPLDQEAYWEGPEQEYIVPTIEDFDFPLSLIVRMVTSDGRTVRGGANRFYSDSSVLDG